MKKILFFFAFLSFMGSAIAQTGSEPEFCSWALTPPIGWNSWDCFGPTVVESEVKANADYMAANLKQYGWEYVVVDIRWFVENDKAGGYNQTNPIYVYDEWGRYTPALNRFPSAADGLGFKPLADYCHNMGLKFGIHLMRGCPKVAVEKKLPVKGADGITCDMICNNDSACTWLRDNMKVDCTKPGAQQYYNSCFDMYAQWGVDFVKIDDLSRPYHTGEIEMIRHAIDQCGREIVLSLSPGETPLDKVDHVRTHANMWRTVDDFWDNWSQLNYQFGVCAKWAPYISPGNWPDADMLPLGKISIRGERGAERWTSFTPDEQQTMMSLWSIFKSPLMFGGDLPQNDEATNALLTNKDVIWMHHYSAANRQVSNYNNNVVWTADNPATGAKYAALFNLGGSEYVASKDALWRSGTISYLTTGYATDVDVELPGGARELALIVTDAGDSFDSDHADWINPTVTLSDGSVVKLTEQTCLRHQVGWGEMHVNKNLEGGSLSIDGKKYDEGFAVHANSILLFDMPPGAVKFSAIAGIDNTGSDQGSRSSVEFMVFDYDPTFRREWTDQWTGGNVQVLIDPSKQAATSGYISKTLGRQSAQIEADITGAPTLYLVVTNGGDDFKYDHADWINPVLIDNEGRETSLTDIKWLDNPINGWYAPKLNRTNDGNTLTIAGEKYSKGFGVNSPSVLTFDLPDGHEYVKFSAMVGYDDEVASAPEGVTVEFRVFTQDPAPDEAGPVTLDIAALGIEATQPCAITDLWTGDALGEYSGREFSPVLPAHGSGLYLIEPQGRTEGTSVALTLPSQIEAAAPFDIDISVDGPTDGAYVQVICDGNIIGMIALNGKSNAVYHCSGLEEGRHTFQAVYSGTPLRTGAVSDVVETSINTGGIEDVVTSPDAIKVETTAGGVMLYSLTDATACAYNLQGIKIAECRASAKGNFTPLAPGLYLISGTAVLIK